MSGAVVALDLGGTHVSAGRVDLEQARVEEWVRVALPQDAGRDVLVEQIARAAKDVAGDVQAVGFAVPGPFDYASGVSWIGHKLDALYGVDLRSSLAGALGLAPEAITFVNDADAFLLGEWWAGAARESSRAVAATLGTGLGSAFLADGRLVASGPNVPPSGEIHRTSHDGAPVEDLVSRAALIRRYGDLDVDVEEIASRGRTGDERALAAFHGVATALGEVFDPWLRAFGATSFVVGGSIAAAWDLLAPGLRASLDDLDGLETIARAELLDHAALLGAAYCVRRRDVGRGAAQPETSVRAPRTPELHPQVEALQRAWTAAGARPLHELTVAEARAAQAAERFEADDSYALDTLDLSGPVPIRLYRPPSAEALPVCIWLAGGGWVLDTIPAAEPTCRRLAAETPCAVATVRYRLAPEHRFPVPVEDCLEATRWLLARAAGLGLDPAHVAIGGTSAGGNLAAAVTLLGRDRGDVSFDAQLLVYPVLLHDTEPTAMDEAAHAGFFDRRDMSWCWSHYLASPDQGSSPLASPLLADDLGRLPPALIVTAGLDPLRHEAERYADRLRQAGVPVELARFDGAPHGFFSLRGRLDAADEAQLLAMKALRRAFSEPR